MRDGDWFGGERRMVELDGKLRKFFREVLVEIRLLIILKNSVVKREDVYNNKNNNRQCLYKVPINSNSGA